MTLGNISGPRVDGLLHLLIVLINSALEESSHSNCWYEEISSRSWKLTSLSWAELKNWWSIYHRLSNSLHGCLLNLIAFIAGNVCFLTQFIRFYGLLLVDMTSWILL